MILDRLTLVNFGVYQGRHTFDLTPLPGKPVVLFVGLNGAGKTTILTALQLAFYGAEASAVRHAAAVGGYTFEDYLLDCINYDDPPADTASIELEFRATREGEEQHFSVRRSWRRVEDSADLREGLSAHRLEVFVNDRPDAALAAAWGETVEELLPLRLSTLFFFDGEKIDQWSNLRGAEQLISDAVHSLLGLDVIDRAISDLQEIQRKAALDLGPDENDRALVTLRDELAVRQRTGAELEQQRVAAADFRKRAESKLQELEPKLIARGIPLLDRQGELIALRDAARERLVRIRFEERARRSTADRSRRERERFGELLRQRDLIMLSAAPAKVRTWLEGWLRDQVTEEFLGQRIGGESPPVMPGTAAPSSPEEEKSLKAELDRLDELIARVPDPLEATALLQEREHTLRELERARFRGEEIDARISQHTAKLTAFASEVDRRAGLAHARKRAHETAARYSSSAASSAVALGAFRSRLIEELCAEIGRRLTANFAQLLHRSDLFDASRILSTRTAAQISFSLVIDLCGRELDPDRFSAGERQMLALALLWALAQTSARRAPIVLDTPLGRLDSAHRVNVATRYLPHVAEQVIVLATDDESEYLRDSRYLSRSVDLGAKCT